MAASHGRKAVFKLDNSGGSLTDISTYVDTAGLQAAVEMADVTTLGKDARVFIPGLSNATIPGGGPLDPTVYVHLAGIHQADSSSSFEFYPAGTASGAPLLSGECWLSALNVNSNVGNRNELTFTLQTSDDVTFGTAT